MKRGWSQTPRSAYIHVPFCKHRCGYCDFALITGREDLHHRYLNALRGQLQVFSKHKLDTLYLGGGTPTQLTPAELGELLQILNSAFDYDSSSEVTIEANPDGLTTDHIAVLVEHGVNRISLGVQSFDAKALKFLERSHTPEDIATVVENLKTKIDNISFDLIFAVAGQSISGWEATLSQALGLEPAHISTYCLTIEKGTQFWNRVSHANMQVVPDQLATEMHQLAIERLTDSGFQHYEVSNFAKQHHRSRHNEIYWRGLPFLAFGPGAAGFLNGTREINHRSVTTWLKRIEAGRSSIAEVDQITPQARACEIFAVGLRRLAGVNRMEFQQVSGEELDELCRGVIRKFERRGWLLDDGETVKLSPEGFFMADTIAGEIIAGNTFDD